MQLWWLSLKLAFSNFYPLFFHSLTNYFTTNEFLNHWNCKFTHKNVDQQLWWWLIKVIFLSKFESIQVNLCQKLSFLNQLTHNMTRYCSLNSRKNTYKFTTCCVQILFWKPKEKPKNNFCTQHVLNLYFLVFNEQSLVILWVN